MATPGVARFTNTNDFTELSLGSITVKDSSASQNFTLNGNGLTLMNGINLSGDPAYAFINLALPGNLWVPNGDLSSAPARQKGAAASVFAITSPRLIEGDVMAKTDGASGTHFEMM